MSKGYLKFDLTNNDDAQAHLRATLADDAFCLINELDNYARQTLKYERISEDAQKLLENVRLTIHNADLLQYYN